MKPVKFSIAILSVLSVFTNDHRGRGFAQAAVSFDGAQTQGLRLIFLEHCADLSVDEFSARMGRRGFGFAWSNDLGDRTCGVFSDAEAAHGRQNDDFREGEVVCRGNDGETEAIASPVILYRDLQVDPAAMLPELDIFYNAIRALSEPSEESSRERLSRCLIDHDELRDERRKDFAVEAFVVRARSSAEARKVSLKRRALQT
ncbi:hypothetical protein ACHAWF_009543 [Thalassiosira exigua]